MTMVPEVHVVGTEAQAAPRTAGVSLDSVSKVFGPGRGPGAVRALDRVSFDVAPGEFLCLVGASGCGRTTLLNLIAGLDRPTGGSVDTGGLRTPDHRATGFWAGRGPVRQTGGVHISAKVDYAVRALLGLTAAGGGAVSADTLATTQELPRQFLQNILNQLRRAGLVTSQRGSEGGYRLARPAADISLADVMRAVEGPLAEVRGDRPEAAIYQGSAEHLQEVWVAVRASLRSVLENVTLADVVAGTLPPAVSALTADPDAWVPH